MKLGVPVLKPYTDERYDLVFDFGERFFRVQCKWASRVGDVLVIRCRRCRRGRAGLIRRVYEPGEIDAIAAYCPEPEGVYLLPSELSVQTAAVQLRIAPTRNNQQRGIKWARDYEFGATLMRLKGP